MKLERAIKILELDIICTSMTYLGNGIATLVDIAGHTWRTIDHGATWVDQGIIVSAPFKDVATDLKDAIRLGIEALKQIDEERNHHILPGTKLLPGETKEQMHKEM